MITTTAQTNTFAPLSFPTIAINTNFFSGIKQHTTRVCQMVTQNKFISAFAAVFSAPVE